MIHESNQYGDDESSARRAATLRKLTYGKRIVQVVRERNADQKQEKRIEASRKS